MAEALASQTVDDAVRADRLRLVREFGNFTQAYSTAVQPGLEYFWYAGCYLAFRRKWGIACVLADPVGDPLQHAALLRAFLQTHRRHCFWQIGRATAQILESLGDWINEMGIDTRLELAGYDFTGKSKERLRHATNWIAKHGFTVREASFGHDVAESDVRAISRAWQAGRRTTREVYFFNRPIVFADEVDVRKFFLFDPGGRSVAFVFFDPLYEHGEVIGYSPAIKRRAPGAPLRSEEGIMKTAIEHFQAEGRKVVMLGLSPMAEIRDEEFRANPLVHFSWSRAKNAWWINRFFYNLAGHAEFKRRFAGKEEQTYYASNCLLNDLRVVATLRMAGAL